MAPAPDPSPPARPARRRVFVGCLVLNGALSAVVIALLVLLIWDPLAAIVPTSTHQQPFVRDGDRWVSVDPSMPAISFAAVKPADTFRVFVLGGSQAMGTPFVTQRMGAGDEIAGLLRLPMDGGLSSASQHLLQTSLPHMTVEVLNAALGGKGSTEALVVFRQIVEMGSPDLVVLLSGNNERLTAAAGIMELDADFDEVIGTLTRTYAANLQTFAQLARDRRVPLHVLTVPTNLRDWVPAEEPDFDPDVVRVLIEEERFTECIALLHQDPEPLNAARLHRLGNCHDRLGHTEEALRLFLAAKDRDRDLHRARTSWNDLIRALPTEEFVRPIELERPFIAAAHGGISGDREFFDYCHMTLWGNHFAGRVVAEAALRHVLGVTGDLALDAIAIPDRSPEQLRRLYWLKRIKWLRFGYQSSIASTGAENTAHVRANYQREIDDLDDRMLWLKLHEARAAQDAANAQPPP